MVLNIFQDYYRILPMKYIVTILAFVFIITIVTLFMNPLYSWKDQVSPLHIPIQEARSRRFGFIVDVRTPEQRNHLGYYPNSVPISLERLRAEVPLDITNKNTWILVYSNGDDKAKLAAEKLFHMGYPNVRFIQETYLSLMPGSK
jgi:rhodanese-related sulfurtransferase